jgi:hypothetical protein
MARRASPRTASALREARWPVAEALLAIVRRGLRCQEWAQVGNTVGNTDDSPTTGTLVCNLKPGHPGPLHYDATDRIWWRADG